MTYQPPPGQPGAPMGGDHPKGTTLLITSIVSLLCCAPVNIWVLITANSILKAPGPYNTGSVGTARIIAIVSLVLWAATFVYGIVTGSYSFS